MTRQRIRLALLATLAAPPFALAHHSTSMFETEKRVTVTGAVKEFQWTNPHAWIQVVVTGPDGMPADWSFECGSPNTLSRQGWKPSTLKPDALEQNPREVTIETVPEGGELELADAQNPVVLYHLATDHAADMLLTYQPTSSSVFVVDIYSPGNGAQLGAADLGAAIAEHAIPTEGLRIVGGHGGIDDYATLAAQLP